MVKITSVSDHSRASRVGIMAGDILISINAREISDVLDYRFFLTDTNVTLKLSRNGEEYTVNIKKQQYDDIGLEFETPLMDKKHSCHNKCIFCFIDQLPKGMRETLYFKDDDSRLSFLHGNYITLTNLTDKDIDRIIEMHISPINISVHTTNPELRVKMMHNKRAGEVLQYMQRLHDAHISMCGQIVLCRGINDGDELLRSMKDLSKLYPYMDSVAIVPAGLTKFRDKLYPLEAFSRDEAREVIRLVDEFALKMKEEHGVRMFFCSDELYLEAELPLPDEDYYEGYSQLEDGVGMITSLENEFNDELEYLEEYMSEYKAPRHISVATGVAAYDCIKGLCVKLEAQVEGLTIDVYKIINHFFGESITVAGLLTGKDISEQLKDKDLGDLLIFPGNALRAAGDVFLDDMSPETLGEKLHVKACPSKKTGDELLRQLLLND